MCETKQEQPTPRVTSCRERAVTRNEAADCTRSVGDVVRHSVGTAMLCLLAVVGGAADVIAAAPKPGEALEMKARSEGKETVIRFRFCPPGSLDPGQPKPTDDGDNKASEGAGGLLASLRSASKVKFNGFFIAETELTISQAAVLLGKDGFQELIDRLISQSLGKGEGLKTNKYLVDALTSRSGDYPIFGVTLNEAVTMCRRMSELTKEQKTGGEVSIERRQFRLPSHAEWQFACRSTVDNAEAKKRPHFHNWVLVDGLDKDIRADWKQIVKEMGGEKQSLVGTQFDLESVLEEKQEESDVPIRVLNAILTTAMKFSRDFANGRGTAPFTSVSGGTPNEWGIHHMHDNVSEWTLANKTPDKLWNQLLTPSMQGTKALFLAGGNNVTSPDLGTPGGWKMLTIWGGYPMDLQSGQPTPWSIAEGNDFETNVNEQMPGVRMLLARTVRENWFAILRRAAMSGDATFQDRRTNIAGIRQTVTDIVPGARSVEMNGFVAFYDGLVLLSSENVEERRAGLKMVTDSSESMAPKSSGGGVDLAALLNPGNSGEKETENPDALFFRLLKLELGADSSTASPVNPAIP